ncbi:PBSX family phage terminase large subunit [Bacillus sp. A01H]|uniref:PBSX family phage terminase large subunit n=1 Tax=Bacillus TaxID=1386 RepID=UPI0021D16B04|nr:PBSX family phage terminase large subunit [Bacillus paranthracis]MCU5206752.1 PBSX family phage terminase large subunit [Bacillus paranthracis]HDR7786443.1 PBSX family phage terminase large subunit [Bacillus paranthracis]
MTNVVKISNVISPHFRDFWVVSRMKEHLRYVLKGGRGSGKSYHIPFRILSDIIEYPISYLVVRKVQHTITKSVFEQIKAAANIMKISHLFRFIPSRLLIEYKPRGNKIYFSGADDPNKLKSLKDADFPIMGLWIEELAEFKTEDEVTTIENSVLRGEMRIESEQRKGRFFSYSFYYSYNPPKRRGHWLNKKYNSAFIDDNTFVDHSTYLDNPHLTEAFYIEAENVKKRNELKYRWEYMGEAIGAGVVPFDNLNIREITDDEIKRFDNIRSGVDWGYGVDPVSFGRIQYDKTRRGIYIFDEYYGVQKSNRELADFIKRKGYDDVYITADSSEPKSIDEMRIEHGIRRFRGAKKGQGSVEYGEKWLADLDFIVIDPVRCPNTAREFENIDYETDRDGNPKPRLQDKDNHTIDMVRYAMEEDMKKGGKIRTMSKSKLGL